MTGLPNSVANSIRREVESLGKWHREKIARQRKRNNLTAPVRQQFVKPNHTTRESERILCAFALREDSLSSTEADWRRKPR